MSELVQIKRTKALEMLQELADRRKEWLYDPQLPLRRVSSKLERSRTEASKQEAPDCLTCGICCAFALPVEVAKSDSIEGLDCVDIVADDAPDGTVINRFLPRDPETAYCSHLGGTLGKSISCSVYEIRPTECRTFDVGSDRCHEFRRMYGLDPQLTEEELAVELPKFPPLSDGKISFVVITTDGFTEIQERDEVGQFQTRLEYTMRITAFLDENPETPYTLHVYDPAKETWFENEFLGMTLDEANDKVESERAKD